MNREHRARSYEKIRADLLAEAEAVGVHTKGAALDPVLELLINGFARELESIYDRVDQALEHNRRTLLRNYFQQPFLESPAQTVVTLQVKHPAPVGPGMRITWQAPAGGLTPEYALLAEREMIPIRLAAAAYWVGEAVYQLDWNGEQHLTSSRFPTPGAGTERPRLLLGFTSPVAEIDSRHLMLLVQPNDTGLPGLFPGSDPQRAFSDYLGAAGWYAGSAAGTFPGARRLTRAQGIDELPPDDRASRFPTETRLFARMLEEHIYASMVHRFTPGVALERSPLPAPLDQVASREGLKELQALAGEAFWLQVELPYPVTEDPRDLLARIAPNARLAIGYRRDPRDRFNFTQDDFNVASELFEFGLADRPGRYCQTFGRWVVTGLTDQGGATYDYVYDALARGRERWFTLEVGPDDVTLLAHLPRRRVPEVGHFDLLTGHLLGAVANTSRLDVLAPRPVNALDYPEVGDLHLLVPARGGGDGYAAGGEEPDSLRAGAAPGLERQYARAAVWLRTRDRLSTLPDLRSFLFASDGRIREVRAARVALEREGQLVPGVRLEVAFDGAAKLAGDEQEAICRMATRQIETRLPIGMWVEVRPASDEAGGALLRAERRHRG